LKFGLPVSRWSLFDSIIEFSDPRNMQIAVGISLLSCIAAEIQVRPVLAAAILNLSFPVLKYGLRSLFDGAINFSDLENMDPINKMFFSNLTALVLRKKHNEKINFRF
jgi:hypothetical protein